MNHYFYTKVSYDKVQEDGLMRRESEGYLIDALSFTEAEERIARELLPYTSGNFTIDRISKMKLAEMLRYVTGEKWYKAKIMMLSIDENRGVEKRLPLFILLNAPEISEALGRLIQSLATSLGDYEIVSITETDILEVYDYEVSAKQAVENFERNVGKITGVSSDEHGVKIDVELND